MKQTKLMDLRSISSESSKNIRNNNTEEAKSSLERHEKYIDNIISKVTLNDLKKQHKPVQLMHLFML